MVHGPWPAGGRPPAGQTLASGRPDAGLPPAGGRPPDKGGSGTPLSKEDRVPCSCTSSDGKSVLVVAHANAEGGLQQEKAPCQTVLYYKSCCRPWIDRALQRNLHGHSHGHGHGPWRSYPEAGLRLAGGRPSAGPRPAFRWPEAGQRPASNSGHSVFTKTKEILATTIGQDDRTQILIYLSVS